MKKLIFIAFMFIFSVNLFCETVYKTYDDKSLFFEDKFLTMKQINRYSTINNYKFKLSVTDIKYYGYTYEFYKLYEEYYLDWHNEKIKTLK